MNSRLEIREKVIEIYKKKLLEILIIYSLFIVLYYLKFFRINYSDEIFLKCIVPIFVYYYLKFIYIFSKEKILIENDEIILIKTFLFITVSKKKIKIKNLQMLIYRENKLPNLLEIIFLPFSFKNLYSIIFQVNEDKKVKNFFCGYNIGKENYELIKSKIMKISDKIIVN